MTTPPAGTAHPLTDAEHTLLIIERQLWTRPGSKEQAIRDLLDIGATRYYQLLVQLLDRPEALVAEPLLIGRLRRIRDSAAQHRQARRVGLARLGLSA